MGCGSSTVQVEAGDSNYGHDAPMQTHVAPSHASTSRGGPLRISVLPSALSSSSSVGRLRAPSATSYASSPFPVSAVDGIARVASLRMLHDGEDDDDEEEDDNEGGEPSAPGLSPAGHPSPNKSQRSSNPSAAKQQRHHMGQVREERGGCVKSGEGRDRGAGMRVKAAAGMAAPVHESAADLFV